MTSDTGQTLRRLGLVVEAASVLAILSVRRGYVRLWDRIGVDPNTVLPAAFLLGVVLWGVGTALIHKARREADA